MVTMLYQSLRENLKLIGGVRTMNFQRIYLDSFIAQTSRLSLGGDSNIGNVLSPMPYNVIIFIYSIMYNLNIVR